MRYLWTAQWDSTEELSENLGQGFLTRVCETQDVYTITYVCPHVRFSWWVSIISITFSNRSLKFIHLADFVPNTSQVWVSVLGVAIQTGSKWIQDVWLVCNWGLLDGRSWKVCFSDLETQYLPLALPLGGCDTGSVTS